MVSSVNRSSRELVSIAAFVATASMLSRKWPTSRFHETIPAAPTATINQPRAARNTPVVFFCRHPSPITPPIMPTFTTPIASMMATAPSRPYSFTPDSIMALATASIATTPSSHQYQVFLSR